MIGNWLKKVKKEIIERCKMKVTVENEFWELFPQAQISIMVVKGLDNSVDESKDPYFKSLLDKGSKRAEDFIVDETFTQNDVIQEWRGAFSKFKTKKGARSSIEALLKRVSQGREFNPINPLVDIYNSVSLSYAVPCGGEDIAKIQGGLYLGKAQGGEPFFPLGAETDAPALPEEIIYYDDEGAVCRCFNWREAQRTMLTEGTKDAVLVIEAINEDQAKRAQAAMQELQSLVEDYFGVKGEITHLTIDNPSVDI
jgi:DNA/RNA-binding domain of Phe-tRNA-synthetase-like protein